MKRMICVILCVVLMAAVFSSCKYTSDDRDDLLKAPMPSGELYGIQKALEKSVSGNYKLEYPTAGEYLSAFNLVDLNGDGTNEAIAFYSTQNSETQNSTNTTVMHLNLIVKNEENDWVSVSDQKISGTNVDSISFGDLNGDGVKEIIVGWTVYSSVDKLLTVYSMVDNTLSQVIGKNYSKFRVSDFTGNGFNELLIIYLNTVEKTADATLYQMIGKEAKEKGKCVIDGSVISYREPKEVKFSNGKTAVYIDAEKSGGEMITEVVFFEDGTLKAPFFDKTLNVNSITHRYGEMPMEDIDGDSIPEIPSMSQLPGYESRDEIEKQYMTQWRKYDGKKLETVEYAFINLEKGYSISFPESEAGTFTVASMLENSLNVFYRWGTEQQHEEELFRIQVVPMKTFEESDGRYDEFFLLGQKDTTAYICRIGTAVDDFLSTEEITDAQKAEARIKHEFKVLE